jgi:predicted TIM-barrel fold metal-dependent hydrolase
VGDRYPELNDLMFSAQKNHPERIVSFGRVDPRRGTEAIDEIKRIHRLGLTGLKLHPYVECFRPDHPFFNDMFGEINDLNMTLLIHTGTMFSSPGYLKGVLKSYPQMKLILGHLQEGCIPLMREFENVYSDTSGCRVKLLEYACETCEDRIVFGSDYPYLNYNVQMEVVRAAELSEAVRDKIFSGNLAKLQF